MKLDLHVHTKERSLCARDSEDAQIQAAITAGLHGLFITDHWLLVPEKRLRELNQTYAPFRIFGGIEVNLDGEDLLVLGIQDPLLEKRQLTYPELHTFVRARSGFLILAHPFRYRSKINLPLDTYPPDAIELYTLNTPREAEGEIRAIAQQNGLSLLSNSDAHISWQVGTHYNILQNGVVDEQTIFRQLRLGTHEFYR